MRNLAYEENAAHLVDADHAETINIFGPTVQFLTPLMGHDDSPCVMRGTIPPGISVPLHAHRDPETFLMISGEIEGLSESEDGFRWGRIKPADIFHVPGGARHAFRNQTSSPAVMTIVSTVRIARFFREVGAPASAGRPSDRPSPEAMRHFKEVADRYGYWNATAEENARIGISLPSA